MNVVVDIGNSICKIGLFDGEQFIEHFYVEEEHLRLKIDSIHQNQTINLIALASVKEHDQKLSDWLKAKGPLVELGAETPVPITVNYDRTTLGNDRLALAVAINHEYPNTHVLGIDAGTCITFDFVSEKGVYEGGAISPGIEIRFKALNTFTGRLPLISALEKFSLIGKNTEESINSGVLNGILKEVDGVIEEYSSRFPSLKVLLTGGNTVFFEKHLKKSIFADPLLVLKGLNTILIYNEGLPRN